MKIKKLNEINPQMPQIPGTKDTTIQWLITKNDGARHYAMRVFTIKPGGQIPLHAHSDMEHEIFVLEGEATLNTGDEEITIKTGDALLIQPNEKHGFTNISTTPFKFICVIPILK
ncbi:MAG: cupin domain-containing protein [bacterium]